MGQGSDTPLRVTEVIACDSRGRWKVRFSDGSDRTVAGQPGHFSHLLAPESHWTLRSDLHRTLAEAAVSAVIRRTSVAIEAIALLLEELRMDSSSAGAREVVERLDRPDDAIIFVVV